MHPCIPTFLALWNPCCVASWCAPSCASSRNWTRRWPVKTPCAACVASSSAFSSTINPTAVPCRGDARIVPGLCQSACLSARRSGGEKKWQSVCGMFLAGDEDEEEEEEAVQGSNQSISSSPAGQTTGSWISPRCIRSRWVVRVGRLCVVRSQTCILSFLSLSLSSSSSSPLIRNSFTLLARVLCVRDVVPMDSGGCAPSLPPRMSSETLFSILEKSLELRGNFTDYLMMGLNK